MAPGKPTSPYKTTAQWAEELGVNVETIRRAIRRKQVLATKLPMSPGPTYVITHADMAAFLEKRRAG